MCLDFVSSIVSSEDKQWHILIIQDIARLLELKFREFKKLINSNPNVNSSKTGTQSKQLSNLNLYMEPDSDLFMKIAESIFRMGVEEPNGILGTRIKLRLMLDDNKLYDMCQFFAYDSNTYATSEITITLKEDVTKLKKFLLGFKFLSSFDRYVSIKIDSNDFEINKKKLY